MIGLRREVILVTTGFVMWTTLVRIGVTIFIVVLVVNVVALVNMVVIGVVTEKERIR